MAERRPGLRPPRTLVLTWMGLVACLAFTLGFAFVPAGAGNLVVALSISLLKAALVVVWFIKLPGEPRLNWVAAAAGLFWLAILFALTSVDYATRVNAPV